MQIVLIGASGFLGSYVVRVLADAGHACTVLTRQPATRREVRLLPEVRLVKADVHSREQLTSHFQAAEAVVSMAGILNERGFSGAEFRKVHVELVEDLIAASKETGVRRVLHVSAINAGEGDSHYLKTKGEAEDALRASGLDVTIFRPSVIFGPGDSFFNRFAAMLRIMPVLPLACPDARLQPVYAGDVARALAAALEDDATIGQIYELAGPRVYSLKEIVQWTARTLGLKRQVIGLPDVVSRLQATVMDFVPGKPFSTDNYKSLQLDNVASRNGFAHFAIQPASIDAIVPDYLRDSRRQERLNASRSRVEDR